MNILLGSKANAEAHFGAKSVMAINLLGMNFQGEKAWKFTPTGMNVGQPCHDSGSYISTLLC